MEMSRYLMVRIAAVSLAILIGALALALWRAQFDVKREEIGAAETVRLFEHLYALENGPRTEVDDQIAQLQRINASEDLRHVQLELRDGLGHVLVAPRTNAPATLAERAFAWLAPGVSSRHAEPSGPWTLQRDDGEVFVVTVSLNPSSEQREALDNLVGMLGVLAGYAIAVLLALYWTLKRALAPLQPILGAMAHYERNDFAYRLPSLRLREMDVIARALNHLAGALGGAQDVRRSLSLKLLTSQEEERTRIARELHDEFGQALTAMRADALWLTRQTAAQPQTQAVARELAHHCERLHLGIRDLLRQLRPRELDDGSARVSLRRLLDDLVRSWRERPGQAVHVDLDYAIDDAQLSDELALTLYRLSQEALTNAMRHADARHVSIALRPWNSDGGADGIEWRCVDDGVGIESGDGAAQRGNGLAGMRERVWAHAGELDITRASTDAQRPGLHLRARFATTALAPKTP
jgi:two-component system sensor histidine kinase UhpB